MKMGFLDEVKQAYKEGKESTEGKRKEEAETNETDEKIASPEQKLAAAYKRILITVICSCLGWPIFVYAFNHSFNPLVMLLGGAIVSAPILFILAKGGGLKDVFKTDEYEVITTHSNGRKTSDGGTQSFMMGLLVKFFMLIFVVLLGCLITIGILVFMIVRYVKLYLQVSEKPPFIKSAFPVLIAGLAVFVGSGFVINLIVRAGQ
jgi:uncharacterized membrane protein